MLHFFQNGALCALLLAQTGLVATQLPAWCSILERENLPSNEVRQFMQDSVGYMYIGCSAGLFKYDGFSFQAISNPRQNGKAISHLLKAKDGSPWCQNFAGQIYRIQGHSLAIFRDFSQAHLDYPQFTLDEASNVWIALSDELVQIAHDGTEAAGRIRRVFRKALCL